ncbi:MAG: BatA domain-containing protein, partial [Clostridia bacterium]|nr:BatA domain-containing protein [Clostridia bacterium]
MMSFFSPWMLLGLAAAATPIILHLLRKRTAERILWGAWMFLADSLRFKRRKLMLEDIVLLVLRTLTLAFAALAFARPFLPELRFFGGTGMDKDVVLVIDASASMKLRDPSGTTAFAKALEEARSLVKESPRGTAFGIVIGEGTPGILTPSPISAKREVLEMLDRLEPGDDAMDAPRS